MPIATESTDLLCLEQIFSRCPRPGYRPGTGLVLTALPSVHGVLRARMGGGEKLGQHPHSKQSKNKTSRHAGVLPQSRRTDGMIGPNTHKQGGYGADIFSALKCSLAEQRS